MELTKWIVKLQIKSLFLTSITFALNHCQVQFSDFFNPNCKVFMSSSILRLLVQPPHKLREHYTLLPYPLQWSSIVVYICTAVFFMKPTSVGWGSWLKLAAFWTTTADQGVCLGMLTHFHNPLAMHGLILIVAQLPSRTGLCICAQEHKLWPLVSVMYGSYVTNKLNDTATFSSVKFSIASIVHPSLLFLLKPVH